MLVSQYSDAAMLATFTACRALSLVAWPRHSAQKVSNDSPTPRLIVWPLWNFACGGQSGL